MPHSQRANPAHQRRAEKQHIRGARPASVGGQPHARDADGRADTEAEVRRDACVKIAELLPQLDDATRISELGKGY